MPELLKGLHNLGKLVAFAMGLIGFCWLFTACKSVSKNANLSDRSSQSAKGSDALEDPPKPEVMVKFRGSSLVLVCKQVMAEKQNRCQTPLVKTLCMAPAAQLGAAVNYLLAAPEAAGFAGSRVAKDSPQRAKLATSFEEEFVGSVLQLPGYPAATEGVRSSCIDWHAYETELLAEAGIDHSKELGDFDVIADGESGMPILCSFVTEIKKPICETCTLKKLCGVQTAKGTLEDAIAAARKSLGDEEKEFDCPLTKEGFRHAFDRCINNEKYAEEIKFLEYAKTPEFRAKADAQRSEFWKMAIYGMAMNVVVPTAIANIKYYLGAAVSARIAQYLSRTSRVSMTELFLYGLCADGASAVSMLMSDGDLKAKDATCGGVSFAQPNQLKSCAASLGTICRGMTGFVDLRNLGLKSENDYLNFMISVGNFGASTACYLGGRVSAAACGFINMSAEQIGMALRTGNNEWAECLGISKAARCIGETWASGGWTNNSGVSVPRKTESSYDGQQYWLRTCCHCEVESYYYLSGRKHNSGLFNELTVTQDGEFATGECARKEGRIIEGNKVATTQQLKRFSNCKRVSVVGSSCALRVPKEGTVDEFIERPAVLWDVNKNYFSGKVLHYTR
jgi:hypothetical protein